MAPKNHNHMGTTTLTWDDYDGLLGVVVSRLDDIKPKPSVVIGIPNGGMVPASQVASRVGRRVRLPGRVSGKGTTLVVDDILDTGDTMCGVLDRLAGSGVVVAVVCGRSDAITMVGARPDVREVVCGRVLGDEGWVCFPWEFYPG